MATETELATAAGPNFAKNFQMMKNLAYTYASAL